MKCIAKILLFCIILSLCSVLTGCFEISFVPVWKERNSEFKAIIIDVSGKDALDFEITKSYDFRIAIYNGELSKYTHEDIQIEYDESNMVVEYMYTSKDRVYYSIYPYEFATDGELKITYKGETITVKYNVVDYDFEANDRIKPASLDELDKYPAFKDMLTSIEYYEFKEPYIGLNEWEYDINEKSGDIMFDYSNYEMVNGYMKTDYLRYLTDSVYYPSKYIGYAMYMNLYSDTDINEGASKSKMHYFALYFALDDPHHNKHPDGITSVAFQAYDLASCEFTDSGKPLSSIMILIERYPDQFYQYRVDDVTIYVLSSKNSGAEAYFIYGDYFYSMSVSYEFD